MAGSILGSQSNAVDGQTVLGTEILNRQPLGRIKQLRMLPGNAGIRHANQAHSGIATDDRPLRRSNLRQCRHRLPVLPVKQHAGKLQMPRHRTQSVRVRRQHRNLLCRRHRRRKPLAELPLRTQIIALGQRPQINRLIGRGMVCLRALANRIFQPCLRLQTGRIPTSKAAPQLLHLIPESHNRRLKPLCLLRKQHTLRLDGIVFRQRSRERMSNGHRRTHRGEIREL